MSKPTVTTEPATTTVEAGYNDEQVKRIVEQHMLREAGIPLNANRRVQAEAQRPAGQPMRYVVELLGDYSKPVKSDAAALTQGFDAEASPSPLNQLACLTYAISRAEYRAAGLTDLQIDELRHFGQVIQGRTA